MKPTVIATPGNSENHPQHHHPGGNNINPNPNPNEGGGNTANAHQTNSRQFPHFETGFDFDPDMDDIFSDAGLRSRLSRFRDPFSFARKRCGNNDPNADPYTKYFEDDTDFFPNFGSLPGRSRRAGNPPASSHGGPSPFFDHIPSEFRHYIPDGFGRRSNSAGSQQPQQQQQPQPPPAPQQQQQQQHPQQYYETYVQPPSPTYSQPPPQQKPKLCDAAIQTDDLLDHNLQKEGKNLKQYGMRNTVDLGQKSPPEQSYGPRSQSAPPTDGPEQNSIDPQQGGGAYATANAYAYSTPGQQQQQQYDPQQQQQQKSQGTQPMTPPHPPPRQHIPNPNQQYQPWHQQQQQQQQQPQQQPQYQQQMPPQQQQQHSQSGSGFVRTVPIIIEGRSNAPKQGGAPPFQQQQQPTKQKPGHPTPLNTQQTPDPNSQMPPQTPHTAECINKIQAIQRDVLNLMGKVENFQGIRNDKEYMYLDEMLTRNLLKLDTIDTNGKDSIRLARREAIKCIQASINVLDAKAEENAKAAAAGTAQQTVMDVEEQTKSDGGFNGATMVNNDNNENTNLSTQETEPIPLHPPSEKDQQNEQTEKVAIPLPPPPEKKRTQIVDESKSNVKEKKISEKDNSSETNQQPQQQPEIVKTPSSKKVEETSKNIENTEKSGTEQIEASSSITTTTTTPATAESTNKNDNAADAGDAAAAADDDKITKDQNPQKMTESVSPKEDGTAEGDGVKSTGAIKKKIIKKKKVVKDKSKSESASPAEKASENAEQPPSEVVDKKKEQIDEKSDKDPNSQA